jgi:hypothetical protein
MNRMPAISNEVPIGKRIKGAEMLSIIFPKARSRARSARTCVSSTVPGGSPEGEVRDRFVGRQHTDPGAACELKRRCHHSTFVLSPVQSEAPPLRPSGSSTWHAISTLRVVALQAYADGKPGSVDNTDPEQTFGPSSEPVVLRCTGGHQADGVLQ